MNGDNIRQRAKNNKNVINDNRVSSVPERISHSATLPSALGKRQSECEKTVFYFKCTCEPCIFSISFQQHVYKIFL